MVDAVEGAMEVTVVDTVDVGSAVSAAKIPIFGLGNGYTSK